MLADDDRVEAPLCLYTQPLPASEVPGFLSLSQKVLSATGIVDLDAVRRQVAREQAT